MNYEPFTSIENPTLAHFRHFSSLFTYLPSTFVENPLQISSFMQNKPNFRKSQMNVSIFSQMDYENLSDWTIGQSKPNSNPIKPNLRKAKMNANDFITKDYRKKADFIVRINKPNFRNGQNERKLNFNKGLQKKRLFSIPKNKPNSNPISVKPKMSVNVFVTKDYENETAFRPKKTNPIQTQFTKGQNELKIACQKIRPHPCRLSHIFGLQFGLIVAKYSEICNHRFVSNNKVVQRAEQYLSFAIDVVK